jgi:hypothetical protein
MAPHSEATLEVDDSDYETFVVARADSELSAVRCPAVMVDTSPCHVSVRGVPNNRFDIVF